MSKPEQSRHLFLSYVTVALVGSECYSRTPGIYKPIEDVKGYIQLDPNTGNISIRCEHVYVELSPKVKEIWEKAQ